MTVPQVRTFFDDYVAAFTDRDIYRICMMWAYPAFMAFEGRQLTFDAPSFKANVERLCHRYTERGMARAEKDVVDLVPLTATTAAVTTNDRVYREDGTLLATWKHAYLLNESDSRISIIAAMPDDENRAWREIDAQRPLGCDQPR